MSKSNGDKKPTVVCIVGVAGFIGSHLLEMIIRVSGALPTLLLARRRLTPSGGWPQERDWVVLGCDMAAPTKIQALLGACAALVGTPAPQSAELAAPPAPP